MKIEKINNDNLKEFIRDMKIDDSSEIELNLKKMELFGIKKEDIFYIGFDSLSQMDTIAILYYNPKLNSNLFYECIDFLDKSLVVENHLIVQVYDKKYMKLFDDKYKCKEINVFFKLSDDVINFFNIGNLNEKFIDIEMKSIKYSISKDIVYCNLIKQNIQDEKLINDLHEFFTTLNVNSVNFTIYPDSLDYFTDFGYDYYCKNYIIRNDF